MTADVTPVPASSITTWDDEADVVIVGYGISGAAAAVEASAAGADVLVVERTGGWGGAAAMAGGFVYLGGGTALQKACGFDDSAENMAAFLKVAMGPGADENRIDDYCAGSVAHYDWLVRCGVPFNPVFWGEPGWEPPGDQGLMYTGGENAFPYNTIAAPAPRGHVPEMADKVAGERSAGYMLVKPLVDTATAQGTRAVYDTHVQSLVVDDGRVVGIVARRYSDTVAIKARRGVVLASGSFAYSDAMVAQYAPRLAGRPAASVEQHDGRSIRMAQALGADLAHMDATEVAFFCDPQQLVRGILVNGRGQRYIAEDTYPGRIGQQTLYYQEDTVYLIIDGDAQEEATAAVSATPFLRREATWVCETVAELEAEIGLPTGTLQNTVAYYNEHAARGEDPLLHKKSLWLRPIGSPVGAIDLRSSTGGFTLGGLMTTLDGRVLHVSGEPIPGLFAAGRAAAGLAAWGYASGVSLGDGSFYGRRAGKSAAAG
ncbi:FAD-dependent oxidoreductase [Mycobacterium sp. OTB74]|uniref:FAD-dependent oxidoreductase n=1 Tax=Mycobacterium sp. OTB74 TaxID=1853452 RepID=UPI0024753EAD|nr:FAD-dependent oxidoreductase [Mycobacterium sp. OTB74]MDH6245105.1 3-oxo-5alpha-steroid 4-dehydrogenase [Mycobacterium sp. OTB74]